ncbi:hypothetical protein ACFV24_02965 [Nocardia fluminea]
MSPSVRMAAREMAAREMAAREMAENCVLTTTRRVLNEQSDADGCR